MSQQQQQSHMIKPTKVSGAKSGLKSGMGMKNTLAPGNKMAAFLKKQKGTRSKLSMKKSGKMAKGSSMMKVPSLAYHSPGAVNNPSFARVQASVRKSMGY